MIAIVHETLLADLAAESLANNLKYSIVKHFEQLDSTVNMYQVILYVLEQAGSAVIYQLNLAQNNIAFPPYSNISFTSTGVYPGANILVTIPSHHGSIEVFNLTENIQLGNNSISVLNGDLQDGAEYTVTIKDVNGVLLYTGVHSPEVNDLPNISRVDLLGIGGGSLYFNVSNDADLQVIVTEGSITLHDSVASYVSDANPQVISGIGVVPSTTYNVTIKYAALDIEIYNENVDCEEVISDIVVASNGDVTFNSGAGFPPGNVFAALYDTESEPTELASILNADITEGANLLEFAVDLSGYSFVRLYLEDAGAGVLIDETNIPVT